MAKILDIAPYKILPALMGGQKGIAIFCKYLGEKHELTVVSVESNEIQAAENYEIIPMFQDKPRRYANPAYVWKMAKLIRSRNIGFIITEHPYMAWMGWLLRVFTGVKWHVHSHNIEFERFKTLRKWWVPVFKFYEIWAYRNCDRAFFKTPEDFEYAVSQKIIPAGKGLNLPYGIEVKEIPQDRLVAKEMVCARHNIPSHASIIFFNGAFGYRPNLDALMFILDKINPLLADWGEEYCILICGKDLPEGLENLKNYAAERVVFAGFVDDVVSYFKAADIFLNPIVTGGGVKTKIVEALSYDVTVISCNTGAAGLDRAACGEKFIIVEDNNAAEFAQKIKENAVKSLQTPPSFYERYYWGHIVDNISDAFQE